MADAYHALIESRPESYPWFDLRPDVGVEVVTVEQPSGAGAYYGSQR
jgi:hypothetical protein